MIMTFSMYAKTNDATIKCKRLIDLFNSSRACRTNLPRFSCHDFIVCVNVHASRRYLTKILMAELSTRQNIVCRRTLCPIIRILVSRKSFRSESQQAG